jgi:hypothetical protein
MYWRFRRRVELAPGFTLNLNKRSTSLSFGERGAHVTYGPCHTRVTAGLPGTGLSATETFGHRPATARRGTTARASGGFLPHLIVAAGLLLLAWHFGLL